MQNDLIKYLNARGIEIRSRQKTSDITDDDQIISDIAGAWKSYKEAITAVVQARCDVLTNKLIYSDMPYEVPVTRQALTELAGILEDFERISQEIANRANSDKEN